MQRRFKSTRGGIDVDLTDDEKVFLTGLLDLLAGIPAAADEPASRRLRVPVYLDDPESNEEWWRLMEGELNAARNADRRVFQHVLDEGGRRHMSNEEADAFLRVLNEGRLALGRPVRPRGGGGPRSNYPRSSGTSWTIWVGSSRTSPRN